MADERCNAYAAGNKEELAIATTRKGEVAVDAGCLYDGFEWQFAKCLLECAPRFAKSYT